MIDDSDNETAARTRAVWPKWLAVALVGIALALTAYLSSQASSDGDAGSDDSDAAGPADRTPHGDEQEDLADERPGDATTGVAITTTTTLPLVPEVRIVEPTPTGGFAESAGLTGGRDQEIVVVTSSADAGPGTYRDALSGGSRYIVFDAALDGVTIELESDVESDGSDITLDGSGVDVTISGHATRFHGTNIVLAGLTFSGFGEDGEEEDAVTFVGPSEDLVIGVYGNVFERATDGLLDIIWNEENEVDATVCGNLFRFHDKAMLINSGDEEREGSEYHVTLCRNHWYDVYQRMPLSRRSHVHQYNSVFERYGKPDGSGGGSKAGDGQGSGEHFLENTVAIPRQKGDETFDGSIVEAPRQEFAGRENGSEGKVRATGSLLVTVDGVEPVANERKADEVFTPDYDYHVVAATPALRDVITDNAGVCVPSGDRRNVSPCAPLHLVDSPTTFVAEVDVPVVTATLIVGDTSFDGASTDGGLTWRFELPADIAPRTELAVVEVVDAAGATGTSPPVLIASVS